MIGKINIFPIIKSHIRTFHAYQKTGISVKDVILFYAFPFAAPLVQWISGKYFHALPSDSGNSKPIEVIVIALSILIPLLMNVLVLIYGLLDRMSDNERSSRENLIILLEETFHNIAYSMLVSFICILALLPLFCSDCSPWIYKTLNLAAAYLLSHLTLTFLMISKRVHIIISKNFNSA